MYLALLNVFEDAGGAYASISTRRSWMIISRFWIAFILCSLVRVRISFLRLNLLDSVLINIGTREGANKRGNSSRLTQGRCEQVPDMRSCLSSGAMEQGSS